jgi:hypothetical protein
LVLEDSRRVREKAHKLKGGVSLDARRKSVAPAQG